MACNSMVVLKKPKEFQKNEDICLPLENVTWFLIDILVRTDKQKKCLERECRYVLDVLAKRSVKVVKSCDEEAKVKDSEDCEQNVARMTAELEEEISSKVDKAIKYAKAVLEDINNKEKTSFCGNKNSDKKALLSCNESTKDKSKPKENTTRKESLKSVKSSNNYSYKKCNSSVKPKKHLVTTYKKDFNPQNNKIALRNSTSCMLSTQSPTGSSGNNFEFKDIDDILKRVTASPAANRVCVKSPLTDKMKDVMPARGNKVSLTTRYEYMTLAEAVCSSRFEFSNELIRIFNLYKKLETRTINYKAKRKCSSNFLLKLKERNNCTLAHTEEMVRQYKKCMKMNEKCSSKVDSPSQMLLCTLETFYCDKPELEELLLKMCHMDAVCTQLELVKKLKEDLPRLNDSPQAYSILFFKMCNSLTNILPKVKIK